jgi:thioesterase domain-containing protein
MLSSYRPRLYPGRIVLFRTQERSLSLLGSREIEPQEIWARLATGGVDLRKVPGDHRSLFKEPNLGILAVELKECLEQAGANVTASPVPTQASVSHRGR